MGIAIAQVLLDGAVVGTVTVGDESEVSPDPLGSGNAFAPAPSPDAFPQYASREYTGSDLGSGHQPSHGGAQSHAAPHRHLGGAHPHHDAHRRRLSPADREHVKHGDVHTFHHPDYGDESKSRRTPEEVAKHPDFGGLPKEESTFAKTAGHSGDGLDREWQRKELEENPALKEALVSSLSRREYRSSRKSSRHGRSGEPW